MDKTFEEIIGETLEEDFNINVDDSNNNSDEESSEGTAELDDNSQEDAIETENSEDSNDVKDEAPDDLEGAEEVTNPSTNDKDVQAFARMRTELKQANTDLAAAQEIIEFFDTRAKQMGLNGVQGLIDKTKEAELAKQAEEKGIPVDVLKRIDELELKVKQQDLEKEQLEKAQKEQHTELIFENFVQNNSLNKEEVEKIAGALLADGFDFKSLMGMSDIAVNKILNSYLPNDSVKQEMLAKKEKAKKEVPVSGNTSSKFNTEEQIDKIAKMWAGAN